jgi:hypothetical protein
MTERPTGPALANPWHITVMSQLIRQVTPKPPPHLLNTQLGSYSISEEDVRRQRVLHLELEQFSYNLRGAYDAVLSLEAQSRDMLDAVPKPTVEELSNRILIRQLPEEQTVRASWAVDRLLDSLRKGQNSLVPYLRRTFNHSLPSSFSDLAKKCAKHAAHLPAEVEQLVADYWSESGKRVKEYRDFAQHHAVVASDARVSFLPDGGCGLFLAMVSNPDRKSLRDIAFNAPYVPAVAYCRDALLIFYSFTYALFYLLVRYVGHPTTLIATFGFKDPLVAGSVDGYIVLPTSTVDEELWSIRDRLKPHLEETFGLLDGSPRARTDAVG